MGVKVCGKEVFLSITSGCMTYESFQGRGMTLVAGPWASTSKSIMIHLQI